MGGTDCYLPRHAAYGWCRVKSDDDEDDDDDKKKKKKHGSASSSSEEEEKEVMVSQGKSRCCNGPARQFFHLLYL